MGANALLRLEPGYVGSRPRPGGFRTEVTVRVGGCAAGERTVKRTRPDGHGIGGLWNGAYPIPA